jgi:hypothetical protein
VKHICPVSHSNTSVQYKPKLLPCFPSNVFSCIVIAVPSSIPKHVASSHIGTGGVGGARYLTPSLRLLEGKKNRKKKVVRPLVPRINIENVMKLGFVLE